MAGRWTADATSNYRKVLAIQQHFHSEGFVYSTDVEPADDADALLALLAFLTQTKPASASSTRPRWRSWCGRWGWRHASRSGTGPVPGRRTPATCSRPRTPTSGWRCCSPATAGSRSSPSTAPLGAVHDIAFSNVDLFLRGLDEVGNKPFAEIVGRALR